MSLLLLRMLHHLFLFSLLFLSLFIFTNKILPFSFVKRELGNKLGYKIPADWYQISKKDIAKNGGNLLLKLHNQSPVEVVINYVGRGEKTEKREDTEIHEWQVWKFKMVPRGWWDNPNNQATYMKYVKYPLLSEKEKVTKT